MVPISTAKAAYGIIIKDEKHRNMTQLADVRSVGASASIAFAVTDQGRTYRDKTTLTYTHCLKGGLDANNCFQLIRFPEWWAENNKIVSGIGGGHNSRGGRSGTARHGRSGLRILVMEEVPLLVQAGGTCSSDPRKWRHHRNFRFHCTSSRNSRTLQ